MGNRVVGKANKGISVEKVIIGSKNLKKRKEKQQQQQLPRTAKAQYRGKGI